jgi:hypothetical protein
MSEQPSDALFALRARELIGNSVKLQWLSRHIFGTLLSLFSLLLLF